MFFSLSLSFQWTALTPAVLDMGCVFMGSATVSPAGVEPAVRSPKPCVLISVQVMVSTTLRPVPALVTRTGPGLTAL